MIIYIDGNDIYKAAEDINKRIISQRKSISNILADPNSDVSRAIDLAQYVNSLAELEGAYEMLAIAVAGMERGASFSEVAEYITTQVLTGADDSWSGRTNDVRRAKYEGKVEVAKTLRRAAKETDGTVIIGAESRALILRDIGSSSSRKMVR